MKRFKLKDERVFTHIAVGRTDGFRYVGTKPPLSDAELQTAELIDFVNTYGFGTTEQIFGKDACTLLGQVITLLKHDAYTAIADATLALGGVMRTLRPSHTITIDQKINVMRGPKSSPFNPITD